MKKFKKAQAQDKAAISKHLQPNNAIDFSSEDEDLNEDALQQAVGKVFTNYQHDGIDTEKILSYLTNICHSGTTQTLQHQGLELRCGLWVPFSLQPPVQIELPLG